MSIRERDLPPDVLRAILERCPQNADAPVEPKAKEFVTPGVAIVGGKLVIMVAVETKNEGNARQWKARNRRAGAAWKAVREAIGSRLALLEPFMDHLAANGAIRATFTRLGGRKLDVMANLGSSLKGIEDAVCYLLGIDDRDPRWVPVPAQEPGGAIGVRIEIEAI